jgi:F0F1-type ATP synthase delta subunit
MSEHRTSSAVAVIVHHIYTTTELQQLLQYIGKCQRLLFSSKQSNQKVLENLPQTVADVVPASVASSTRLLDEWLKQLIQDLQRIPVATVTVAYVPTVSQSNELVKIIRSGFETDIVVELKTDVSMLAGARIELQNRRVENTLQSDITELFSDTSAVTETLSSERTNE